MTSSRPVPELSTQTLVLLDIPPSILKPSPPDLSQLVVHNGALAPPTSTKIVHNPGHKTAYAYLNFPSKAHAAYFLSLSAGSLYVGGERCRLVARKLADSATGAGGGGATDGKNSSRRHPHHHHHNRQRRPHQHRRKGWSCGDCLKVNFGFRNVCFGCGAARDKVGTDLTDEDQMLLYDVRGAAEKVGSSSSLSGSPSVAGGGVSGGPSSGGPPNLRNVGPSRELIVRGLASRTKEDTLRRLFGILAGGDDKILGVKLIRDRETRQSKRYAFVRFVSVDVAKMVLRSVCTNGMIVDQARVVAGFAEELDTGSEMKTYFPPSYVARKRREELERIQREKKKKQKALLQEREEGGAAASAAAVVGAVPLLQPSKDSLAVIAARRVEQLQVSGFSFETKSGYYHNPKSCRYYDPQTDLYYIPEMGSWCCKDPVTGEFSPKTEDDEEEEEEEVQERRNASHMHGKQQQRLPSSSSLPVSSSPADISPVFGNLGFGNSRSGSSGGGGGAGAGGSTGISSVFGSVSSGTGGSPSIDVFGMTRTATTTTTTSSPIPIPIPLPMPQPQPQLQPRPRPRPRPQPKHGPAPPPSRLEVAAPSVGSSFVPNPKFEQALARVTAESASHELKKLQRRATRIGSKTRRVQQKKQQVQVKGQKRTHGQAFPEANLRDNIGKKMLKGMGWVEGSGIGVKGRPDEIDVRIRDGRKGIGFGGPGRVVGRGGRGSSGGVDRRKQRQLQFQKRHRDFDQRQ